MLKAGDRVVWLYRGFLLINESPIGNGPSTEMRVDGKYMVDVGGDGGGWMGAAGEFCGSIKL